MYHRVHWTVEKVTQRLALIQPLIFRQSTPLPALECLPVADARIEPFEAMQGAPASAWIPLEPNDYWLRWKQNFILRTQFIVPADWGTDAPVALYLPLHTEDGEGHPEALVYIDGQPLAGCDRNHYVIELPAIYCDDQPHVLMLHGWTSNGDWREHTRPLLDQCRIVQIDSPTRAFIARARVALGAVKTLDEQNPVRAYLLNALEAAFIALNTREPLGGDAFYASVQAADQVLQDMLADAAPPEARRVAASGHAHIDVAWLWTLGQTRRKAGRTFHSVLRLMEAFPEFHFTQSQPQLYEYIRQDYPELFRAIQVQVERGQWEPIGGMWVEADCNLTGAEALARQFVLGQAFFREHFGEGAASPVLWLPDVFGYAWSLPQLIKEAGLEYFFTIKIGWNQYNRLPYDSFWWQGIDGTRVLTHFSTTPGLAPGEISTYNARATTEQVIGTWNNFQQKDAQRELFMAFGFGDGGGGPTREMLENLALMTAFPGVPQVRHTTAGDFFRQLEASSGERLPVWNGELYLEFHRGTYTGQARNKHANRKSEFLLHDAEFLAAYAALLDSAATYPHTELTHAWRLLCLNQFHDIIPGSSIGEVYEESMRDYGVIQQLGSEVRDAALHDIATRLGGEVLLANTTSFTRHDLVFLPFEVAEGQALARFSETPLPMQLTSSGVWLDVGELAPYSVQPLRWTTADPTQGSITTILSADLHHMENAYLRVEFNSEGDITHIYDKQYEREVLPPGQIANQFQLFEDRTHTKWDAWDTEIYFDDRCTLAQAAVAMQIIEAGPLRATLEITRRIGQSDYTQRISLSHNARRLDITTTIQWRERHALLKVAFQVDILSPTATYEIQWGSVQRPTHHNTSWDWARFETCAQKWVDLSESDYGVSLLNDCKYGHDIHENIMRISLLRGSTFPDAHADVGEHTFTYSLLPHTGGWGTETIRQAYLLNVPVVVYVTNSEQRDRSSAIVKSLVSVDRPNVVIETVKQAEDGNGLIVRLFESQRQRGTFSLSTGFPLERAWRTNLLEENQAELDVKADSVKAAIKPYQIITLRLLPA